MRGIMISEKFGISEEHGSELGELDLACYWLQSGNAPRSQQHSHSN